MTTQRPSPSELGSVQRSSLSLSGGDSASHVPRVKVLGGSWAVISGVVSPLIWVITIVTLLITPLITTHEPPSMEPRCTFEARIYLLHQLQS